MQETSVVDLPTEVIEPNALWLGMVRYYGHLSAMPGWEDLHPLFDFVKQLSTSVVSIDFYPALIDDTLFISKTPISPDGELPRRVSIDMENDQRVSITCHPPGNDDPSFLSAPRASALNALWRILQKL